jgi:citrate synthase
MTEFTTSISHVQSGTVNLRGYSLADVMRNLSYTEGAHLCIVGRLPTPDEHRLLDAVLNSLLDHGFVASTITAARYIASGNPQLVPAVAGGMLAAGSNTLSPEHAYELLDRAADLRESLGLSLAETAERIVREYREAGRRIPGFGHPTHKDTDFRADILFEIVCELGVRGDSVAQYSRIHAEFVRVTGKTGVPINIDGALAAIGRDLGWSVYQTVSFALLSVLPGVMAHVIEEIGSGRPLRHITNGTYVGSPLGELRLNSNGAA